MDTIIIIGFIVVVAAVLIKRRKPELYASLKSKLKFK
jgi:hypothetical protein